MLLAAAPLAPARAQEELPDGIPAGRWVLAPFVRFTYENDDNIFRRSESTGQVEADQVATIWGGATASLPVRNSLLELSAELSRFDYKNNEFPRDFSRDFGAIFTSNFGTGDTVSISERFLRGISSTQVRDADPGGDVGELTFQGRPFNLNEIQLEVIRAVPTNIGYSININRLDLNWERVEGFIPSYDYRGWNNGVEVRKPIPGRRWIIASYDRRRLDHFDPNEEEADFGEPFRKEASDGRFAFKLVPSSEFEGLVGSARWRVPVGGRSKLDMAVIRRPLPSTFDTYYISNDLRVHLSREWLRDSRVGVDIRVGRNVYGDLLKNSEGSLVCGDSIRKDTRTVADVYADWSPSQRVGFRVGAQIDNRDSNCETFEYQSSQLLAGVSYGWY
jgi:hypothetical protein